MYRKIRRKIDGFVASIMALDRCIRNGTDSGSVYDERGVIAFLFLSAGCNYLEFQVEGLHELDEGIKLRRCLQCFDTGY